MAEPAMAASAAAAAPESAAVPPPSLLSTLRGLWQELPGLLNDRVELLSLELQRAGSALVRIVMLVVVAAILGVTAWLVLWGGIVMALVAAGHMLRPERLALESSCGTSALALGL
jgi:uncharacterized membrane protein YqjE